MALSQQRKDAAISCFNKHSDTLAKFLDGKGFNTRPLLSERAKDALLFGDAYTFFVTASKDMAPLIRGLDINFSIRLWHEQRPMMLEVARSGDEALRTMIECMQNSRNSYLASSIGDLFVRSITHFRLEMCKFVAKFVPSIDIVHASTENFRSNVNVYNNFTERFRLLVAMGARASIDRGLLQAEFSINGNRRNIQAPINSDTIGIAEEMGIVIPERDIFYYARGEIDKRVSTKWVDVIKSVGFDINHEFEGLGHLMPIVVRTSRPEVVAQLAKAGAKLTNLKLGGKKIPDLASLLDRNSDRYLIALNAIIRAQEDAERSYLIEACIGLRELDLPVLLLREIYAQLVELQSMRVEPVDVWEIAKTVKHFNVEV